VTSSEKAGGVISAPVSKSRGNRGAKGEPVMPCETHCFVAQLLRERVSNVAVTETILAADGSAGSVPALGTRPASSRAALWWSLSTGVSVLGTEGAAGYLHSTAAMTLAAAEVTTLMISALGLLVVILMVVLHARDEDREHLYRFLRLVGNRPEPAAPPATPFVTGNAESGMKAGTPAVGHANGPRREAKRTRAALPVLEEPLPDGVITLRQWAERIGRASSTVITHWQQRSGFPSPIGQLPSQSRQRGAGERLYAKTELDAWRMTQARLQRVICQAIHKS